MKRIRSKVAEKWIDENDILYIKYLEGVRVDTTSVFESKVENEALVGDKRQLVLCDARASFTITPDAQKHAVSELINKSRIATAVITNKAYVQILTNFALRFSKLRSSVKMFKKEEEALKWLHSFKRN